MEVRASVKNIRISPKKVRLVIDTVRGAKVDKALAQLSFLNKKATDVVSKAVKSAIANATNTYELDADNLFIKTIRVDEGAAMKRWMPKARGRATPIIKKSSHLHITLGELVDSGHKEGKKQTLEAPISLFAKAKEKGTDKVAEAMSDSDTKLNEEKGKRVPATRTEGKGMNAKPEGKKSKGFAAKMFNRKAG